jgi:hypothetical protein
MAERTVLIVEGPGHLSRRYRDLARRGGFKVLSSNSGSMTKSVLRRSQPDLVLLAPDIAPPGPSEIARSIKEDPMTQDIPVLMLIGRKPQLSSAYPTEGSARVDAGDDEILSTMRLLTAKTRRLRYGPKPRGPLEGKLGTDQLPEVLQFLFASRKTGRVTILNGARRPGRIYIEAGDVVHAEYVDQDGMVAFKKLCFATHGRFRFEPEERTAHRTMMRSGMELLLESAREKDDADRSTKAKRAHGGSRGSKRHAYTKGGSSLSSVANHDNGSGKSAPWLQRFVAFFSKP